MLIAALLAAGCGSSGTPATTSRAVTSRSPTATMVGSGTPPASGRRGGARARRTPAMATGRHDHAGEFCSGREQAAYAGEGLMCVTGRLKPAR